MKNFLSAGFLILNYLLFLVFVPFVQSNHNFAFESVVLLFTIFATMSNLSFGVPPFIVRNLANGIFVTISMKKIIVLSIFSVLLLLLLNLAAISFEIIFIIFLAPMIFITNQLRGYLEGKSKFIYSFGTKFLITAILPLMFSLYFLYDFNYFLIYTFVALFLIIITKISWQRKGKKSKELSFFELYPFFIQFLAAFLFIFLDRWIVLLFYGPEIFADFSFKFEIIMKVSLPLGFILTLLFPVISKIKKNNDDRRKIAIYPFLYCASIFPLLIIGTYIYKILGFDETYLFLQNNIYEILFCALIIGLNLFVQRIIMGVEKISKISGILLIATLISSCIGIFVTLTTLNVIFVLLVKSFVELSIYLIWIIYKGRRSAALIKSLYSNI